MQFAAWVPISWSCSMARDFKRVLPSPGFDRFAITSLPVDGDVAFAADDPLVDVIASRLRVRHIHRPAFEHTTRGACFTPGTLTAEHQRHIMNGLKQHGAYEPPEPPIDGLLVCHGAKLVGNMRQPPPLRAM
jgi:hypothetical protein